MPIQLCRWMRPVTQPCLSVTTEWQMLFALTGGSEALTVWLLRARVLHPHSTDVPVCSLPDAQAFFFSLSLSAHHRACCHGVAGAEAKEHAEHTMFGAGGLSRMGVLVLRGDVIRVGSYSSGLRQRQVRHSRARCGRYTEASVAGMGTACSGRTQRADWFC